MPDGSNDGALPSQNPPAPIQEPKPVIPEGFIISKHSGKLVNKSISEKRSAQWKKAWEAKKSQNTQSAKNGFFGDKKAATKKAWKAKYKTEEKIKIRYSPWSHQRKFADLIRAGKRVILLLGGIRSGKTTAGAYESLRQIYTYCRKPCLGWIISPTYPMSLVTERAFEEAAGDLIIKKYRGERSYLLYPFRGSDIPFKVEVKSAENPDRLRGAGLGFVWVDEAAMITEECWKIILGRVLSSQGIIILTTTPRGKNWIYDKVFLEAEKNPNYGVVKARTLDNKSLVHSEVESLRGLYSTDFARQELDAEFVSFEGLVYKGFDFSKYVCAPMTEFPQSAEIIGGVDVGYADPFVHLWIMKHNGKMYIVDEYYERFRTIESHATSIKSNRWDKYTIRRWADPSGAQERTDLERYGVGTYPAKNDIKAGINEVERMFESGRLYIAQNCLHTLEEIGQYHYPDKDGRNKGEAPIDFANHTMDALRYVVYSECGYQQAHPSFYVGEDGNVYQEDRGNSHLSNRLEDWIKLPVNEPSYWESED